MDVFCFFYGVFGVLILLSVMVVVVGHAYRESLNEEDGNKEEDGIAQMMSVNMVDDDEDE